MNNEVYAHFIDNSSHGDDALLTRELGPDSFLDVVLDGVSMGDGGHASRLTKEKLESGNISSLSDVIQLLSESNDELYQTTHGYSLTTSTAALKLGNILYVANVGDSPGYLLREGEIIELATMDKGARVNEITNAVGISPSFSCHTYEIELKPNDKVVLVTDGISDNLYEDEIARTVSNEGTPQEAVYALENLLREKKNSNTGRHDFFESFKDDDATAIIRYFVAAEPIPDKKYYQFGDNYSSKDIIEPLAQELGDAFSRYNMDNLARHLDWVIESNFRGIGRLSEDNVLHLIDEFRKYAVEADPTKAGIVYDKLGEGFSRIIT